MDQNYKDSIHYLECQVWLRL